jgi:SecD/SecF fusion protein
MKNQGIIKIFTLALALVCLFHISFTIKARLEDKKKEAITAGDKELEKRYLDSISGIKVYNLGIRKYSYQEVKERTLNLGLDLQGGMNVTLEVSLPDVLKALANNTTDPKFKEALDLAGKKSTNSQADYVTLFIQSVREVAPGVKLSTYFAHKDNKDKVTFNTSDADVEKFLKAEAHDAVDRTYKILSSRIDRFGVAQPVIQKLENSGRIMVELPGINDPERARKLLQSSARLEFWKTYLPYQSFGFVEQMDKALKKRNDLAKAEAGEESEETAAPIQPVQENLLTGEASVTESPAQDTTNTEAENTLLGSVSDDTSGSDTAMTAEKFREQYPLISLLRSERAYMNITGDNQFGESAQIAFVSIFDTAKINSIINDPEIREVIPSDVVFAWHYKPESESTLVGLYALKAGRDGAASLDGDVITDARSQIGNNGFEVSMSMNGEGKIAWKRLTAEAASQKPNGCIAIVLDGFVYSAPRVQQEIAGGNSQISGNFTQDETKYLANILKSGKLPAPAKIVEEAIVGPSLGKDAVRSGLISIIAGFISVILIMAVIYSTAGWVANVAVLLNLYFMIGVLASLQAALTLPGIAGIILSLGMAVDANVLINERIKEELSAGRNLRNAIASGYKNALSAILDSNITTLIVGFVLLVFGSGPIYGFAVTLIIGILTSLFTAILITRIIFEWAAKKEKNVKFSIPATQNLLRGTNFDFIGKRKMFYGASSAIIIAGIISVFARGGLDYGVDFKGGWSYVVAFEEAANPVSVREELSVPFEGAPEVKVFGTNNQLKITTDYNIDDQSADAAEKVIGKLNSGLQGLNIKYTVESTNRVGPTIADDIKQSAVMSVLIALLLMFVYILIRFGKWQFAAGTVIKLAHDVLIVLAFFSLLEGVVPFTLEIDQSFIAAILTVIGYSINDSVVVMDRVREFIGDGKNTRGIKSIINNALNDTLSRTLITSLATIGVLIILFIFGGEIIRGFSFAMLIGVLAGSYSSLCIGAPLAADLTKEKD